MKLATIAWRDGTSAALVLDDAAHALRALPGRAGALDVVDAIEHPLAPDEIDATLEAAPVPLREVTLLPPVLHPPKNVLCVGLNYLEHVREGARVAGRDTRRPGAPVYFTKPHTALIGHESPIVLDRGVTGALDYEGELAVVIGRSLRDASPPGAMQAVFGYTILNDVTARDLQRDRRQWFKGKSLDTFAPCGPWIVTPDEIGDPQDLGIRTEVNGDVRQDDSTRNMIFGVAELLADLSSGMTLEPGDIVATGTPHGVGFAMDPPRYLQAGDRVTVSIDSIGTLSNPVVEAPA